MKRTQAIFGAFLSAILLASLTQAQMSQNGEKSGGLAIDNSQENYADGSKYPAAQYEKPKADHRFALTEAASGKEMAPAVATEMQSELPAGFTLGSATAVRLSQTASTASLARALTGAKDGSETTDTPASSGTAKAANVKWIVDYPVLYKGVPLSQMSGFLVISGGDGEVQYIRKRNLPRSVDATTATVDKKAAVEVGVTSAKAGGTVKTTEPSLEVWVDPALKGHLAWSFLVSNDSATEPVARKYWVAAVGAPQILNWESQVYSTDFGTVTGTVITFPTLPTTSNPLPRKRPCDMSLTGSKSPAEVV